ncbi:YgiQ family radical SAM protein [Candidatus Woesearchaeota archaeon]|nr:YgiQ family radical SAM protein [Candidatus Woesearchaeota archaeon]
MPNKNMSTQNASSKNVSNPKIEQQPKQQYDIIFISGEYYVDHPSSSIGVIVKVLEDKGYSVAVIEKPDWKTDKDFLKFGTPRLFFGVTSGSMDSMIVNYTPLKKARAEDENRPYFSGMPDRAVTVYCNKLRQLFKESIIVIGGIEASMRRFVHYDYWNNDLRKPILFDSRADILIYGAGEYQIVEIANRLKKNKKERDNEKKDEEDKVKKENINEEKNKEEINKKNASKTIAEVREAINETLKGIEGTAIISKEDPAASNFTIFPSFDEVYKDKKLFCKMQLLLTNNKNLAQKIDNRYVLQYKMHKYTTEELDHIYGLNYSRNIPGKFPEFKMAQFSVVTHRGCIGDCYFCSIPLHMGGRIISRSEASILDEIKRITKHKDFKGQIDDLGGASANMYGMDCIKCDSKKCMLCNNLDKSHFKLIYLLREARKIHGVKKLFVRSGIRYDLAIESEEYVKEISKHHISGCLKIAPEHFSRKVLKLMNKDTYINGIDKFEIFKRMFEKINKPLSQYLKYYIMTGHPGSTMEEVIFLEKKLKQLKNTESIQLFTPTPMTISTCMYYTGLNPFTLEKVYVPYTYHEKKVQKNVLYEKRDTDRRREDKRWKEHKPKWKEIGR